uniref:Uncharacterized protein n=1 Tax=Aplanochytrium stocchinoi TaxID=215587 RepID=A0A7S3PKV4_9STRA|eukprot:CAMPEP_0204875926 /NCGR_PEP_ID=MMETSP1348-20121228/47265_1 /ASSEMBLY_ACC=CAM_ASM_000700 /TAXON_ID=215587 /ORGANISM="Aplanochytrium stocchinoi, Strain GSBS06" /LENGTH=251 /DNA_ID=CAMNT_0052032607 /DNA_START=68 /DNA_END=823 /DNA_ORIENTATION=-
MDQAYEAARSCLDNFILDEGTSLKAVIAIVVIFRLLHLATMVNDFPGRSLNWPVDGHETSLTEQLYATVLFLSLVVTEAFEFILNGAIVVQCPVSVSPSLWTTSFFRIFKNCFIDMNVTIKTWKRAKDVWVKNTKIAVALFILFYAAMLIIGGLSLYAGKIEPFNNQTHVVPSLTTSELCQAAEESDVVPAAFPALLFLSQMMFVLNRFFWTLDAVDDQLVDVPLPSYSLCGKKQENEPNPDAENTDTNAD